MDAIDPALWASVQDEAARWIVPSGAALAVILIGLMWWQLRRRSLSTIGRAITTPLVLLWEAQGLHHLAVVSGAKGVAAWVLAGVTSAVLITLAAYADDHHKKHGNLGWAGRLVWIVAVPMGFAVALTATTGAEFMLRVILPLLVAVVWWIPYAPDIVKRVAAAGEQVRKSGAFRLSPRRILVWAGLVDPTDADLSVVHEERQIRRLTTAAHKLHHGMSLWRPVRAARLRRLGLVATPEMVAEVARRVKLVHDIERLTAPVPVGQDAPTGTRADGSEPESDSRADSGEPESDTRVEPPESPASTPPEPPDPFKPRPRRTRTRQLDPSADGEPDSRAGNTRAEIAARVDSEFSQYIAYLDEKRKEPDGKMIAGWVGYANSANGRGVRLTWRTRLAREINDGTRARPAYLPGEVAVLLPPEVRTRVPGTGVPAPSDASDTQGAVTLGVPQAVATDPTSTGETQPAATEETQPATV